MASVIFQLNIQFLDSQPCIWRRVLIEEQSSFIDLHETIQVVMNWTDEKDFFFLIDEAQVADPDDYEGSAADDIIDAYETELGDLLLQQKNPFLYRYFDDDSDWRLELTIESITEKSSNKNYPVCTDGALQAPPETCKNLNEYKELLLDYDSAVLLEKETARDLLGEDYDPSAFNIDEVNDELLSFIELEFPLGNFEQFNYLDNTETIALQQLLQPSPLEVFQLQLENAKLQFQQYKSMGEKAIEQVPDKGLFWKFNEHSNSISTLVKHLWENMYVQWTDFLTVDEEKPWQNQEFKKDINSRKILLDRWEEGWLCLFTTLDELKAGNWNNSVSIKKEEHPVWQVINSQLTHYAYHIGQIVFLSKMLTAHSWQNLSATPSESKTYNIKKMD